jgi:hypothetical protein
MQHADLLSVEAVELPHSLDTLQRFVVSHDFLRKMKAW